MADVALDKMLAEFPRPGAIDWQRFDNEREIKLASASEVSPDHSTLFQARINEEFKPDFRQRLRHAARELLPPIVTRQPRKYL